VEGFTILYQEGGKRKMMKTEVHQDKKYEFNVLEINWKKKYQVERVINELK
jgi:hypothetical protein